MIVFHFWRPDQPTLQPTPQWNEVQALAYRSVPVPSGTSRTGVKPAPSPLIVRKGCQVARIGSCPRPKVGGTVSAAEAATTDACSRMGTAGDRLAAWARIAYAMFFGVTILNPHDLDHTIIHHINSKAKDLEQTLGSDVVSYFGQIHPQYFRLFRNFVEEVKQKSSRRDRCLSVVLRTPGGSAETAERYVTVVRQHYDTVNFIVPDLAMSAGTIFCMSGDKIFMDYSSALGPIDPQIMATDGSGYVAALGYLDKVAEITQKAQLSAADVVFLRGMDLAKLALFEQARDLSIDLLKNGSCSSSLRIGTNTVHPILAQRLPTTKNPRVPQKLPQPFPTIRSGFPMDEH